MVLKKVALPVGVVGKSYWEAMILGITNDKFCSLRANFKQELFEQFQGKFYSIQTRKWFSDTNEIMIYVFHINTDDNENGWFPPSNSSGKINNQSLSSSLLLQSSSAYAMLPLLMPHCRRCHCRRSSQCAATTAKKCASAKLLPLLPSWPPPRRPCPHIRSSTMSLTTLILCQIILKYMI